MKITEKLKMTRSYFMHCLLRSNVGDVKMTSFKSCSTNIMPLLGFKVFHRKMNVNSTSIEKGIGEYIIAQKDHKRRHQKCDFH